MATEGMATLTLFPEIVPCTLTTERPEMNVTHDPAGIALPAVSSIVAPAEGGAHDGAADGAAVGAEDAVADAD